MKAKQKIAGVLVLAALMGGCGSSSYRTNEPYQSSSSSSGVQPYSSEYGVVDSIQVVQAAGNTSGGGAVLGGVVGGLLGNQVGGGSGRTAATVAGAVGGAVVGNQIEKNNKNNNREMYQIGIRLNRGGYQTVTQDNISDLRVGDRVRIENERVYRD